MYTKIQIIMCVLYKFIYINIIELERNNSYRSKTLV